MNTAKQYRIVDESGSPVQELTQEIFEQVFITATTVCKDLKIERSTLTHKQKAGNFPKGVLIGNVILFQKNDVSETIKNWDEALRKTRSKYAETNTK